MEPLLKTLSKKLLATRKKNSDNTEQSHINDVSLDNLDPRTLKPIVEVVLQSDDLIVTIDNSLSVNWMTNGGYKGYAKDFSTVTAKVQLLSGQIDQLFAHKANRYTYKKIIAEALALALDEKKSVNALALLKEVEGRIKDYGKERVRIAYIFYASLTTCLIGILIGTFIYFKSKDWLFAGNTNLYQICITTLMGGVGAFVSTFFRFRNYEGNIISGLSVHRLDGFLRVLYGCIAALVLGLAIYSNIIFGFLNTAANQWVIYLLATIAGASEFLVPNIVRSSATEKENEIREEENPDRNKSIEEMMMAYENKQNGVSTESLCQENKEPDDLREKVYSNKNKPTEETVMIYGNKENENDTESLYLNEEADEIYEAAYSDKNKSIEKLRMADENKEDGNDDETLYQQKEEHAEAREDEHTDKNILREETTIVCENKNEKENSETLNEENKEFDEIQVDEDANKNMPIEEPVIIFNDNGYEEGNKTLSQENTKPNKLQEDIKIIRQLVQGRMDLQDY